MFVVWCLLLDRYSLLFADCCSLCVVRCVLRVVCCLSCVAC